MFGDNGGSAAASPLDNLTEDDIVLLDGDYDEVGGPEKGLHYYM